MKKITFAISLCLLSLSASAQEYISQRPAEQDASFKVSGYFKKDGTIQDSSFRTIGHADGIPMKWAAYFFFFQN